MNKDTGFTLIEVLIAMLVLSVGLLGFAGLQATSIRSNQSAYNRSQATQLAYDMADRIRANPDDAKKLLVSAYIGDTRNAAAVKQPTCSNPPVGCLSAVMAQNDFAEWKGNITSNTNGLGALGYGVVAVNPATTTFTITINWDDNRDNVADSDPNNAIPDDPNFQMSFQL